MAGLVALAERELSHSRVAGLANGEPSLKARSVRSGRRHTSEADSAMTVSRAFSYPSPASASAT